MIIKKALKTKMPILKRCKTEQDDDEFARRQQHQHIRIHKQVWDSKPTTESAVVDTNEKDKEGTGANGKVSFLKSRWYCENAGLLALTRVGSRRVVQISACFMLFFSILGKFRALFASIPMPIIAAFYCVLFSYVASAGIGFLQFCNLNSFRTKFILGFSIFMGFSVPQYFNLTLVLTGHGPVNTNSISFNVIVNVIFSSHATVAGITAYFLDCTLYRKDSAVRRDCGLVWWDKFRYYERDTRSEEFYSLPYNLGKHFPSF
ncbi:hypothetical protein MKX03_020026 [Papaver bracteatum]|nr:hypothetical protein MKX03_020026 [Papaver bracteatum]